MGKWITSIIAWLQIVASPLFIGILIGFIVYYNIPSVTGLVLGIAISAIGLIIGIVWASRVKKKRGTVEFISEIRASPDFDKLNEELK
jgi:chromate transport protein ChrA